MIKKRPLISLKVKQLSTYDQLQSLASEAPSSSISKNQKKSFKPGHFQAKLSIKIDVPKCFEITVVMLVGIQSHNYFSERKGKYFYTFNHFYSEKTSKQHKSTTMTPNLLEQMCNHPKVKETNFTRASYLSEVLVGLSMCF